MKYLSILLLFTLFGISDNAPKEKRIALLIGNGHYNKKYYSPLENPPNDVNEMEKILKDKGFEVIKIKNADLDKMESAITNFVMKIRKEKQNIHQKVVSLFYYAGHGNYLAQEDESYLIPINSNIAFEAQFKRKAYPVSELLELLEKSANYLNIVMLDACRSNPVFEDKLDGQVAGDEYPDLFNGVKSHKSEAKNYNLFISYATSRNGYSESGDRKFRTSPYVAAFKETMKTYGEISIFRFFPMVHQKTIKLSKINKPQTDIQFTKDFAFGKFQKNISEKEKEAQAKAPKGMIFVEGGTYKRSERHYFSIQVNSFYIDQHEVTFKEYDTFCEEWEFDKPSDSGWGRGNRPVINVTWYEAILFCNWRSKRDNLTPCYTINPKKIDPTNTSRYDRLKWEVKCNWNANGYRLPTEAEWEYAAGGGKMNRTKWAGTNYESLLSKYANTDASNDGYQYTAPVGTFEPNALNLYDMSGNVMEWCWDWDGFDYSKYKNQTLKNYRGAATGSGRIQKGGCYEGYGIFLTVNEEDSDTPSQSDEFIGFRCAKNYQ